MESQKLVLTAADYTIFAITLLVSASIGIYFRFSGGQQKTHEEYLLAGRDMAILPVAMSQMATFQSAGTLMALPSDVYLYGSSLVFMSVGFILGPLISAYVFIPVYFKIGVSTAYEYLEKRFGKTTRRILSTVFVFQFTLFSALILYIPAIALSAVTNLSIATSIISVGAVCTCYSSLAGMKAVLWADVFQTFLMYACALAIIIKGSYDMGSIKNIFNIAVDGGRLSIPSLALDFEARYTFLSVCLQSTVLTASSYGCTQIQVQRMLTLKNIKRSRIATFLSVPMLVTFWLLSCTCGLVLYAHFRSCDPMTSSNKPIHSADQMLPFYIMSAMGEYPGLRGLCVSGIFSASLSTVSSAINSLAAVTSKDLLQPLWPNLHSVTVTKVLSLFYGLLCIALSFLAASVGNIVKTTFILSGIILGPTFGIFLLATLSKTANEEGAVLGAIAGVVVATGLSFSSPPGKSSALPVSNECPGSSSILHTNQSMHNLTNYITIPNEESQYYIYNSSVNLTNSTSYSVAETHGNHFYVSFMWIGTFSLVACLLVGYIGSLAAGCLYKTPKEVPIIYLSPIRRWFSEKKYKHECEKNKENKDVSLQNIPMKPMHESQCTDFL